MDTLRLKENWNAIAGELRMRSGHLTDDDLRLVEGKEEELLRRLEKRLLQPREVILEMIAKF